MGRLILLVLVAMMACTGKEFHREYFPDGSLKEEYEVKNGAFNGIGRMFHKNGTISYEGKFENGKNSGWHIHYGSDGQVTYKLLYEIVDGSERILKRIRMNGGELVSETSFAKKNISVTYNDARKYRVGDTLRLKLELLNPKYTFCEAVLGNFDEYLNRLKEPPFPPENVEGNSDHEVIMRILLTKSGRDTLTGLFRDFDYFPITDSTGRVIGEDSFFSFVVDVKP